jgi:PTH1 family peptidyl-tRNA hydrolase
LHSSDFPRLRIGIGHPQKSQMKGRDHVLSAASGDEGILLTSGEERAIDAIQMLLAQGIEATMNVFNTDPEALARKAEEQERKKREREERARLQRETLEQQSRAKTLDQTSDTSAAS